MLNPVAPTITNDVMSAINFLYLCRLEKESGDQYMVHIKNLTHVANRLFLLEALARRCEEANIDWLKIANTAPKLAKELASLVDEL